jgi:hypothetical protein
MEEHDKITAMEKAIDFLVNEVRKIGFFVERTDDNVQKLGEGLEGLTVRVDRLGITVNRIDERLIRVEMNQTADKEDISDHERRIIKLEGAN